MLTFYMFSLHYPIQKLYLKKRDFDLIDLLPQITHGGSMRYVIAKLKLKKILSNQVNDIIKKIP